MAESSPAGTRLAPPAWLVRFGRQLRVARARAGLTQQQLAAPDLTKSFVSLLEAGRSYPSLETVLALARRLRASVGSLTLDPVELRSDTALDLLHLAWQMDPALHGSTALAATAMAERLLPDMPADARVRALLVRARVAMAAGQMRKAARLAREAVEISRGLGSALGWALAVQGTVEGRRGAFARAVPILEKAVKIMRKTRSIRSQEGVRALLSLGASCTRTGNVRRAQGAYQRALELAVRVDLPRLEARALAGLGMLQWARGRHDVAVEFLGRAYDHFEQLEDPGERGLVLTNLGRIRLEQGLHKEALTVLKKALRIREQQGDIRGASATLDEIARVLAAMGAWREAAHAVRRARAHARTAQDQAREAIAGVTLARILAGQKRRRQAAQVLRRAVASLRRLGMRREAAAVLKELKYPAYSSALRVRELPRGHLAVPGL